MSLISLFFPLDFVKLLGVTLTTTAIFWQHVNLVSQSCFYHIKAGPSAILDIHLTLKLPVLLAMP